MSTARGFETRQRSLRESFAELARDPDSEALVARLRDRLGSAPGDERASAVRLLEQMIGAYDPSGTVAPTIVALLRADLVADDVTVALAGEPSWTPEPDELLSSSDVLAMARVRGQAHARVQAEPMYGADAVAKLLGSAAINAREYARQVRRRPGVLALKVGNRYVFPAFQFDPSERRVHPLAAEVNELLDADKEPWATASFWFTIDPYLKARPADLITDTERAAEIRLAAERELAHVG